MKLQNDKWKIFVVMAVSFALLTGQPSVVSAAEGQASAAETTQEDNKEEGKEGDESQENQGNENNGPDGTLPDTANLRLIFTSDIHGQVTTEDYENGTIFTTGGLSRTATLIKEAREEVNGSNSMLFDLGDSLYDYTTDYIYNYDSSAKQPVYNAMSLLGYDAVTLGNHDFDYTLPYIQEQLKASGLDDKVVLSNVKDVNTNKNIWAENKIIEKSVVTDSGRPISVKVGLIGETVPTLSKKRTNYTGILQTEDIVENVKAEAAILKEKGADLVVVLAHSGIGKENPGFKDSNTGYALTKVDGVDAVLCGHYHTDFPSKDVSIYDNLPGVDLGTGLVNGKNLVQVKHRGASIGIADLRISDADNKISIVDRKTSLRNVDASTEVDAAINNCMGDWAKTFLLDCTEILCELDDDTELQNYFGTQEDTDLIQLLNHIKISYGIGYINNEEEAYKDYPVVAASSYLRYGSGDGNDFIEITDEFKRSNMYDLVNYKTGLYLYEMTGAQIREWLEWSVSCYETAGENPLSSKEFPAYAKEKPLQYALQEAYLNDWKNFYVFDGIEYTVDTKNAPRYDENGKKINDTKRISSLTRNGKEIGDSEVFVVATHRLPANPLFESMDSKKIVSTSTEKYRNHIEEYIEKIAETGNLKPIRDNNWEVVYSEDYNYVLGSSEKAQVKMENRKWLPELLDNIDRCQYYLFDPGKLPKEDKTGPAVNALAVNESNKKGTIAVQATDRSGVSHIKYAAGKYGMDNAVWKTAEEITKGSFQYKKNGIYSILAEDTKGNCSITYVKTSNINTGMLEAPAVTTYSNKKKYIEGKAEAGARIYFKIENGKTYSAAVSKNGTFKYKLPPQKAGTKIYVYVVDSKGKTSVRKTITVKRSGPNQPALNGIKTNSKAVSGKLNDTYAYPMVLVNDKTLYVQDQNVAELYKKSSFYNKGYKVVVTSMKITSSGTFSFNLPDYLKADIVVKLKTVDTLSRCGLQSTTEVLQMKPRKPEVAAVSNLSKSVKVYSGEKCQSASVRIGDKKYSVSKASYSKEKGYCYTVKVPRSDSTSTFRVYLTNAKGNSSVVSLHPIEKAPNRPTLNKVKKSAKKVTGKVHLVGGKDGVNTVKSTKTKVYLYVNGKKYTGKVKNDGSFSVKVKKLKKKDKLVCMARNLNGVSLKRTVYVK